MSALYTAITSSLFKVIDGTAFCEEMKKFSTIEVDFSETEQMFDLYNVGMEDVAAPDGSHSEDVEKDFFETIQRHLVPESSVTIDTISVETGGASNATRSMGVYRTTVTKDSIVNKSLLGH